MADEKIILEIAIDNEAARKNAILLNKQLIEQRKALKQLQKTTDETAKNTEEYAEAELELKNEISQTSKELRLNNNVLKANEGSKAANSAQTSILIERSKQLDQTTEEGRKEFERLSTIIGKNTQVLKDQEATQNNFRRNVGNYTNSIIEASNASDLFGGKTAQLGGVFKTATAGIKGATLGFKGLKGAIVATGIGALLIALTSLVALLTSTRKGAQFVEKALGLIGGVTTELIKGFSDFGAAIVGVINGTTSLTDALGSFFNIFDPERIAEGAKAGLEAAESNIKQRESIRALTVEIAKNQNIAEQNRKIRDDETKSLQERLEANDRVLEAEKARTSGQLQLTGLRIQAIENERKISGELNDEQLQELAELNAEILEIQEDFAGRTTEQLTERNALIREANAERAQAEKDTIDALLLQQEEGTAESLRLQKAAIAAERDLQLQAANDEIKNAQALNARKLLIEAEYQQGLKDIKEQEAEVLKAIDTQTFNFQVESGEALLSKNIDLGLKSIDNLNKQADAKQEIADKENQIGEDNLRAAQSFFAAGEALAKEGTIAAKIFGIANATISTYQAGANALATVPFPANIAALAAVIGTGLAQVANIVGVQFEEGGSLASGGMEGTRQKGKTDNLLGSAPNLPLFQFGGQEFITNKAATLNNLDALKTINSFGANTKFQVMPAFQTGGIVESQSSSNVQSQFQLADILKNFPAPIVSVSDISKGFSNVGVSENGGSFG